MVLLTVALENMKKGQDLEYGIAEQMLTYCNEMDGNWCHPSEDQFSNMYQQP